jgi:uncharacterized protein (TIGR02145 family)
MKQKILVIITLAFIGLSTTYGQVGVGTNSPDASAALEVQSTTKGFLLPRMDTDARNAINSGDIAPGLVIYNTDDNCLQWYIGNNTWHDGCGNNPYLQYPEGAVFCESGPTEIVEVTSAGSRVWMDRNLGASKAASSSTDADSYGDLYQWGRAADGHQCRTSPTTSTLATNSAPNTGAAWDGYFIFTGTTSPRDWLQTQDNFLWNTNDPTNANDPSPGKGATDPCPSGYRLPTEAEWNDERLSWSSIDRDGAFASPLKLPWAGYRSFSIGSLADGGNNGFYWSSTVSSTESLELFFYSSAAGVNSNYRAFGFAVRCLKD